MFLKKEWNKLESKFTNACSLAIFKRNMITSLEPPKPLFNYSIPRKSQIIVAQIRIGFSDLNAHLYDRGCTEFPRCSCGHKREDIRHFLWVCPLYNDIRNVLIDKLANMNLKVPINFKLLLYGNNQLPINVNQSIHNHLSKYLLDSNRFLNFNSARSTS